MVYRIYQREIGTKRWYKCPTIDSTQRELDAGINDWAEASTMKRAKLLKNELEEVFDIHEFTIKKVKNRSRYYILKKA